MLARGIDVEQLKTHILILFHPFLPRKGGGNEYLHKLCRSGVVPSSGGSAGLVVTSDGLATSSFLLLVAMPFVTSGF